MKERKFKAMTRETRMEAALWEAKKTVLEYIENEAKFTEDWRVDEMDETDFNLYLSALELIGEAILEYGILPNETAPF